MSVHIADAVVVEVGAGAVVEAAAERVVGVADILQGADVLTADAYTLILKN